MAPLSYEERAIEKDVILGSAPRRVFRALTEAADLRGWLVTNGEAEAVPGGRLTLRWESGATVYITFAELDPDERVIMEWHDTGNPGATLVRIELTPEIACNGTRLRLTDSGYGQGQEWDQTYERASRRWDAALAALESYLRGSE